MSVKTHIEATIYLHWTFLCEVYRTLSDSVSDPKQSELHYKEAYIS